MDLVHYNLHTFLQSLQEPLSPDMMVQLCYEATLEIQQLHNDRPPILYRDINTYQFVLKGTSLILGEVDSTYEAKTPCPPETVDSPWTMKSDIYNLGLVFYEIIGGKSFADKDMPALIMEGSLPIPDNCPLVCLLPLLPINVFIKALRDIIFSCLATNPTERPDVNQLAIRLSICMFIIPNRHSNSYIVQSIDHKGTPLINAIQQHDQETVRQLIHLGANVNLANRELTPLMVAAYFNNVEAVELLVNYGALLEAVDMYGRTTLSIASHQGHMRVLEVLLKMGANVNGGETKPLVGAISSGSIECVQMLVKHGVSLEDCGDIPALHIAVRNNHIDIVEYLVRKGLPIDCRDVFGCTALFTARTSMMVEKLLTLGANVDITDSNGITALMHAARVGNIEVLTILARHTPIDNPDHLGFTALAHSVNAQQLECVEILLQLGANPNISYAKDLPTTPHFQNIIKLLMQYGASMASHFAFFF